MGMSAHRLPDHGGSAFPTPGMTLLDYFAGQALAGNLAYSHVNPTQGNYQENCSLERLAHDAYSIAEAMIEEKRRRKGGAA